MSLASERRALVERAFPGVICKRVEYKFHQFTPDNSFYRYFAQGRKFSLSCCVEAPAEVLVAHRLVDGEDIESLPSSGRRYRLRRTDRGTYQASVYWSDDPDTPSLARDVAARIGISHVEKASNVIPFPRRPGQARIAVDEPRAQDMSNDEIARPSNVDPRLMEIIRHWPDLPEAVAEAIYRDAVAIGRVR